MTTEEFSNQFDVRLNTFSATIPFGGESSVVDIVCDEYEKSVYLTKAQRDLVVALYTGRWGDSHDAFEQTEEVRRYLNKLIRTYTTDISTSEDVEHIKTGSYFIQLPEDLMFIVFEQAKISDEEADCADGNIADVVATTHDYFHRQKRNPFRGPNMRRVLRLDSGLAPNGTSQDNTIELVSKYALGSYYCRYLSYPTPIVVATLPDGLTVDGTSKITECEMPKSVHEIILDNAVALAITDKRKQVSSGN